MLVSTNKVKQKIIKKMLWIKALSSTGVHGKAYNEADNAVGFGELTFHDLWHCAIKYLRFAGNDNFVINIVC